MVFSINSCENGALSVFSDGSWTTTPACPDVDFDDDGIPNNLDIDDDNDGILDVLEKNRQTENFVKPDVITDFNHNWRNNNIRASGTITGFRYNTSPVGVTGSITYTNINGARIRASDQLFRLKTFNNSNVPSPGNDFGELTITVPSPDISDVPGVDIASNPLIINDLDGDFTFRLRVTTLNGVVTDINKLEHTITNGITKGQTTLTEVSSGLFEVHVQYNIVPANPANLTTEEEKGPNLRIDILNEFVTEYFIDIIGATTPQGDNIIIPVSRDLLTDLDPDGDGTPSHLDLDSDNDGCSDALEAGSTTNTAANFNYTNTDVGTNGLSNSIETSDLQSAVNISPIDTTNAYVSGVVCP